MPIRLLVVDDHTLFRRGLMALLARDERVTVVAEAADAGEALRHAAQHQPDVVLLDNHLPGVHGIDALPQLLAREPSAQLAAAIRRGLQDAALRESLLAHAATHIEQMGFRPTAQAFSVLADRLMRRAGVPAVAAATA